jgi:hypothetical protein
MDFSYKQGYAQSAQMADLGSFLQRPGFVQLWERETPLESLSKRQRAAKFGSINKPE